MTDLSVLATASGRFTIAALDHRDALQAEFSRIGADSGADELRRFKRDVLDALGRCDERPSAVMLEPELALPDLRAAVPPGVGVTCALEAQGYLSSPAAGNQLLEGWSPARVREVGADAAKLLVLYRHDRGSFTDDQERLVAEVVGDAAAADVPVLIEPVPIDVVDDADRRTVILAAARRLNPLGPMLLKLPYPGPGACGELTAACGERPWVLLSWGVAYPDFCRQLVEACAAGCSGFAVGRALWREGVDPVGRPAFTASILPDRWAALTAIAATARPWSRPDRRSG